MRGWCAWPSLKVLLECASERRCLRFARRRLGRLFSYLPEQPGYDKRLRALAPMTAPLLSTLACRSPSWCEKLRLLDTTPIACAARRARRHERQLEGG
jgi:hypothetical protein